MDSPGVEGVSSLLFFIFSAWRLGGPLLLDGLSKVQGISRLTQGLQGGPSSSHYPVSIVGLAFQSEARTKLIDTYLDLSGGARITRFSKPSFVIFVILSWRHRAGILIVSARSGSLVCLWMAVVAVRGFRVLMISRCFAGGEGNWVGMREVVRWRRRILIG